MDFKVTRRAGAYPMIDVGPMAAGVQIGYVW